MSYTMNMRSKFVNSSLYTHFKSYYNSPVNNESFMNATSATYLEDMHRLWKDDPKNVHASWDIYFRGVESGRPVGSAYVSPPSMSVPVAGGKQRVTATSPAPLTSVGESLNESTVREYLELQSIIQSFRIRGHLAATLDPLNIVRGEHIKSTRMQKLVLRHYKLPKDLNKKYILHNTDYISGGEKSLSVSEILKRLETAYCGSVGVEYMHIGNQDKYEFIRYKFESPGAVRSMSPHEKKLILKRLIRASGFEDYLAKKYPSEKRFGLEGGEAMIPALKTAIDTASALGVDIFNIGIAHRGRLNVLANVVRKPLQDIFAQFLPVNIEEQLGSGDVKYHLGTYMERVNSETKRPVVVSVIANPSHLESINPVVIGKTHAERVLIGDTEGNKVWSILIHGDAATTGQGVVYETFHLSELPCYTNHGSIHIIINNQIGFTTDPRVSRTSEYCTEVAKVSSAPIFHVNGDDPEAVCYVMKTATEFKHEFKSDVVVDIVCYRKHGHNEADQPMFTNPFMYKTIQKLKPVYVKYKEELLKHRVIDEEDVQKMEKYTSDWLHDGFEKAKSVTLVKARDWLDSPWKNFFTPDKDPLDVPVTGANQEVLLKIGEAVSTPPPNFEIHTGLVRVLRGRKEMMSANKVDWSFGESFAIGSLLEEGYNVRLTGQDVERGTFSHRHHVYHHQSLDHVTYTPLKSLFPGGGTYVVCNSSLSEFGVLGFELGYSMVSPYNLVMWEAQFGDFANSAQIISDQFLSSGESKWARQTGLVVLLPHGMEGQGPEHSSGRPERFLQMSAEPEKPLENMPKQMHLANWFIANPTTPANLFHVLRRQLKLNYRKPLILFTPKSLLRHPEAKSSLEEFTGETMFKPYIKDETITSPGSVEKVILCCGKVFYDLKYERAKRKLDTKVAICRIEQVFPFPYSDLRKDMSQYPKAQVLWAQEEHKNQGWWDFVKTRVAAVVDRPVEYRGRAPSPAPSSGTKVMHDKEQVTFLEKCFS
ncbi:hypothetical protein J6590_026937 [Homalodisca vitripennis]|nr:hypothetical protein J6590_026937 [Homalodisca vitripennis]